MLSHNAWLRLLILALACGFQSPQRGWAQESEEFSLPDKSPLQLSPESTPVENLSQVSRAALYQDTQSARLEGTFRGAETEAVYPLVGPAVVIVRTSTGHGTGFFIDPQGWLITNHHVIAGAAIDPKSGAQQAHIAIGKLEDGYIKIDGEPVRAKVYKDSEAKDLALLKLDALPAGLSEVPTIKLAKDPLKIGATCLAIGHPASGVPWTIRKGDVSGAGDFPHDMMNVVIPAIAAKKQERIIWQDTLAKLPRRKVLLSDCGLSPGDSGGPLVNPQGELIGVSFAVPKQDIIGSAKLAYHVHLDELKDFLKDRPTEPLLCVPDPWPMGNRYEMVDLDGDKVPETVAFGMGAGGGVTGLLIDLEQDKQAKLSKQERQDAINQHTWKCSFAMQQSPLRRVFYDTDGDGELDFVLVDDNDDQVADVTYRREEGKWVLQKSAGFRMIQDKRFTDETMRQRFLKIAKKIFP
jgi:S1-C subfamily serine protease